MKLKGCVKLETDDDCRAIPESFLEMFLEGGLYHNFIELVKKPELELCFRGNSYSKDSGPTSGGRVCIYRNNHAVFTITPRTIYFNTAYLKYCSDRKERLDKLINVYGFNGGKSVDCEKKVNSKNTTVSKKADAEIMNQIVELYENVLEKVFDDYFEAKDVLEKRRQQQLFTKMQNQTDDYFFYDMEFQQKHENKAAQDAAKKNGESNKPDMQAIRFGKDGKPNALVFVEVKSTESAYKGKSGVIKHMESMRNYREDLYLEKRQREAYLLLHQYERLGLRTFERKLEEAEYMQLPLMHIFVFTDKAIEKWEKDKRKEIVAIKNKPENQKKLEISLPNGAIGLIIQM